MNRIDQSLDDIIKMQKVEKKKTAATKGGASTKGNPTQKANKNTIPKKVAGGVKSRAAIRTERAVRTAKPNSPYAVRSINLLVLLTRVVIILGIGKKRYLTYERLFDSFSPYRNPPVPRRRLPCSQHHTRQQRRPSKRSLRPDTLQNPKEPSNSTRPTTKQD